ncbi:hypothetical protein CB0940_02017 [Cercospora beticola]|uniref:Uncharacterized protein n=1 Tax=Cercospora beticola TaxID=122368 RepID=A0A2G5IB69_CERBT|nr:hypothetical protein CB0940_02017 [Cercospora beticola]PIB01703.1 hypothetical protein CB0940_02017 [Cercospora beticola]
MKKRRSRRYSDDEYEDDRDSRDDRENGYRSDGHRSRRSDAKKPVDGADDFDEINNRPRRKRSRARRRDDDDKYGKDDGHHRSSRKRGGIEYGDGAIPPAEPPPPSVTYTDPMAGAAAMGGRFAAAQAFQQNGAFGSPAPSNGAYGSPLPSNGAYGSPQASSGAYGSPQPFQPQPNIAGSVNSSFGHDPNQPPARSTSTLRGGMSTGYVPYAHIYGGPTHAQGYPPPQSDVGSVQPTYMNQVAATKVAPPPSDYQQNPAVDSMMIGTITNRGAATNPTKPLVNHDVSAAGLEDRGETDRHRKTATTPKTPAMNEAEADEDDPVHPLETSHRPQSHQRQGKGMLILVIVLHHITLVTAVSIGISMIIPLCAARVKIVLNTRRHHLPLRVRTTTPPQSQQQRLQPESEGTDRAAGVSFMMRHLG